MMKNTLLWYMLTFSILVSIILNWYYFQIGILIAKYSVYLKIWCLFSIDIMFFYWYQFKKIVSFNWFSQLIMFIGIKKFCYNLYLLFVCLHPFVDEWQKGGEEFRFIYASVLLCVMHISCFIIYLVLLVFWASLHIYICLLSMHILRGSFYEAYL